MMQYYKLTPNLFIFSTHSEQEIRLTGCEMVDGTTPKVLLVEGKM